MRTDRPPTARLIALAMMSCSLPLLAQGPVPTSVAASPDIPRALLYGLIALAVVQVVFILSLSSIMRTMAGPGAWAKRSGTGAGRALLLIPLLAGFAATANAQAFKGDPNTLSAYHLFWWLTGTNIFLFLVLLVQFNLLRGMTRAITGADDRPAVRPVCTGPSWEQRLYARLTRTRSLEEEKEIIMHHEYDGIRELDNVLPPWWVWLFYGTVIWGVVYFIGAHVTGSLPDQRTEYANEMAQAKADITAYNAQLGSIVDEHSVKLTTDPAVLSTGMAIFKQNCTPCHGADAAGSETSVGPNLTDAYWLHGGGVHNVFRTISNGVPQKGMISWKTQLKPNEIAALSSYLLSLQGTGPATQKAPQGDLWKEEALPADSTGARPDSTAVVAATRPAGH